MRADPARSRRDRAEHDIVADRQIVVRAIGRAFAPIFGADGDGDTVLRPGAANADLAEIARQRARHDIL